MPPMEPQCAPKVLRYSEDAGYLEFVKHLLLEYPLLQPDQRLDVFVPATAEKSLKFAQLFDSISPNVFLTITAAPAPDGVPPSTPSKTSSRQRTPRATPNSHAVEATSAKNTTPEAPPPHKQPQNTPLDIPQASADWIRCMGLVNPFDSGVQFPKFIRIDPERDLGVSPARMAQLEAQLWDSHFCAHKYTKDEQLCVLFLIFKRFLADPELPQDLHLSDEQLLYFLTACRAMYKPQLPFHTLWHCVDVTQFTAYLTLNPKTPWNHLNAADRLALVLSGLGHDMLHSGLNTPTLVSIDPEFGVNYGSLEKFHCHIFHAVLDQLWPSATEYWKALISRAIEATELAKHASYFNISRDSPYFFVHVLKMSDFASTARFDDAAYDLTAAKIYKESCIETQVSRLLELQPQKQQVTKVQLQVTFFDRFVLPYFTWLVEQVPSLQPFLDRAVHLRMRYNSGPEEPPATAQKKQKTEKLQS